MPIKKGSKRIYFPRVIEAREALASKALDLFELCEQIIRDAHANGEFEVALKGVQHLMEHMPKEEGKTLLEASVDKAIQEGGQKGPLIQIGIALGPANQIKALPPSSEVIDVTNQNDHIRTPNVIRTNDPTD